MENVMRLENWELSYLDNWVPVKFQNPSFSGEVYGHPKFKDGERIITGNVVGFKDGVFKTYSGSLYSLGKVLKEYENEFPNAKERVLEAGKNFPEF